MNKHCFLLKKRGQGAMEYLMTYGWAIAVILAAGIILWRVGVLNIGGSTAATPTSTGFTAIKPLLAQCYREEARCSMDTPCSMSVGPYGYWDEAPFNCVFTNGIGSDIYILGINVSDSTSDNKCGWVTVTDNLGGGRFSMPAPSGYGIYYSTGMPTPTEWSWGDSNYNPVSGQHCQYDTSYSYCHTVEKGGVFYLSAGSCPPEFPGMTAFEAGYTTAPINEPYVMEVEITYGVEIAGIKTIKTERGTVRGTRTQASNTYTDSFSCPFLYVWDGQKYKFAKDFSGAGFIGFYSKPQVDTFPQDMIPIYNPPLKDGRISIRVVEERNEVDYVDELKLIAVDHPADVAVRALDARAVPAMGYLTVENPQVVEGEYDYRFTAGRNVAAARDAEGKDVTEALSAYDYGYVQAKPYVELDLGDFSLDSEVKLLVAGVSNFEDFNAQTKYVSIDVVGLDGGWVKATDAGRVDRIDYPPGDPYTFVYNLTGIFMSSNHTIRVNYDVDTRLDWVGVDTSTQRGVVVHEGIHAGEADFRHHGISRVVENGLKDFFDYSVTSEAASRFTGNATKYGDVAALLDETDDMYVIMVAGDEIAVDFDVSTLPPVPDGYARSYFVYAYSWFLPGNNVMGDDYQPAYSIEPLPFKGMSMHPYFPPESYPSDEVHNSYRALWNTRVITHSTRMPPAVSLRMIEELGNAGS